MAATKKRKKSRPAKKVRKGTSKQRRQRISKSGRSKSIKAPPPVEEPLAENRDDLSDDFDAIEKK
jgi:hypothetical protein